MIEQSWHSIRVYYYDVDKDALLLDCIRPLFTTLREDQGIERLYFTRHWEGGSHLRLHVYTDAPSFEHHIGPFIINVVGSYLRIHPSGGSFSAEEAVRQHERRGRMVPGGLVYTAPVPNNSILPVSYDLAERVGIAGTARLLEDYYIDTNDLVFTIIEQTRNNYTVRLNTCFDQLLAFIASISRITPKIAWMSYRSHSEAYIVCEPAVEDPQLRRQRLAQAFRERHDVIMRRIRRLLYRLEAAPEQLAPWLSSMIAIHRSYYERTLQGVLDGSVKLNGTDNEYQWADDPQQSALSASGFHAAMAANATTQQMQRHPYALTNRVILNFLYLNLSRLGMLNEDRYILDYYIAEALEELFHVSAVDLVRNFKGLDAVGFPVS